MIKARTHIIRATELTALSVWRLVQDQGFTSEDFLTEEESKAREKLIDQAGVDAMAALLTDVPAVLEVVGSEGRKHTHQYGEALPTLMGTFGTGSMKLDMVNDVVEGSKAAKLNTPGAVSVIAVSSHRGLMGTPLDIDYMDKLFGPPQLKGKLSLNNPVEQNLAEVVDTFGVRPDQIQVVILDRDRNGHYINACQKFGVNLVLIKAGDFLPSILSFMDPKSSLPKQRSGIHLIMGIGGFEEGVMAAVAGKALGALVEARGWSGDIMIAKKYRQIWSLEELVAGKIENCLVSISSITGDNRWFQLPPVTVKGSGHQISTLTVDQSGVKIKSTIHH